MVPVLGLARFNGRISVYGDSSCLDSSKNNNFCFWLLEKILDFTSEGKITNEIRNTKFDILTKRYISQNTELPERQSDNKFFEFSKISIDDIVTSTTYSFQNESKNTKNDFKYKNTSILIVLIPTILFFLILIWVAYLFISKTKYVNKPRIRERIASV
jgi:hypothetical protein